MRRCIYCNVAPIADVIGELHACGRSARMLGRLRFAGACAPPWVATWRLTSQQQETRFHRRTASAPPVRTFRYPR